MTNRILFAERLRQLCSEAGSISKVARDLKINRQQFARYLNGTTFPRPPVIEAIARYFGVSVADLFTPIHAGPGEREPVRALPALLDVMARAGISDVTDEDLEPGFYLIYKRSFRYAERVFIGLTLVKKDARGVMRFKRRTSARYVHQFPGADPTNQFFGVFARHEEHLIMMDRATSHPGLVVFALLPSLHFDRRIKPGLHLMMGTVGQRQPLVARMFLERVPDNCAAVLAAARRQGFYDDSDLPQRVLYLLDTPHESQSHMMGINT